MRAHPHTTAPACLALALFLAACGSQGEGGGAAQASSRPPGDAASRPAAAPAGRPECDEGDGGIDLPDGFCALVVADDVGRARHLAVAPNGDVYVALAPRRDGGAAGVLALRDTTGDGRADVRERFGEDGGTGILLADSALYFAPDDRVLRYQIQGGALAPAGARETVVSGLPADGGHRAKSLALGRDGSLYVNVGSRTNSCQEADRAAESPGIDPCVELQRRAGIWRFAASRKNQSSRDGERFATGLRNVVALTIHPESGGLYGLQQGRDQLFQNWPKLFDARAGAEKPSEEMVRIEKGADFGWPYCYHDPELGRLVQAPEYGGDGKKADRCADKQEPVFAFPAHWAPLDVLFYTGDQFPARYKGGAFIAFHGSWNRDPLPQQGYNVAFLPFETERPAGRFEVFADGFAGAERDPKDAAHRPAGLAQGPDGSLYVTDDAGGRLWRIVYTRGDEPGAGR